MERSHLTNTMLEDRALGPRERMVVALPLDPRQLIVEGHLLDLRQLMVEGHPRDRRRPMDLELERCRQAHTLRMGAQCPRPRQPQAAMITQEDDSLVYNCIIFET